MIISTGMRTDIPAFYSKWFLNRIREGYVCVRNPYFQNKVTKYILDPKIVDCLCFCTKNPIPLISHLDDIKDYGQFWFVTITSYGEDLEPNVPNKNLVIDAFKTLSQKLGKNAVSWRYDPILYGNEFDLEKHAQGFENIATKLNGYTDSCVISFLELYEKVKRNAPNIRRPTIEDQIELCKALKEIATKNNIKLRTCLEGTHLAQFGLDVSGCQTQQIIEKAIGTHLIVPSKKNQREGCNCLLGQDIGAYNSCGHLCKYCYANMDAKLVQNNMKKHDPNSPFLLGNYEPDDIITQAKQESYIDLQTSIF